MDTVIDRRYDVVAFGAHPDDLEVVMGGTAAKLARAGRSILFVDLCEGEPARLASRGARHDQAVKAADILGVERTMLTLTASQVGGSGCGRAPSGFRAA